MIKFRNPGTDYNTQIAFFKILYESFKNYESFDLADIARVTTNNNLMTAYGFGGDTAVKLSSNKDKSRDSVQMNAKMYAEVFRQLGWISSAGEGAYPVKFTFIGECVASLEDPLPLFEQCVLGISYPQNTVDVKFNENSRPFKTILKCLVDLGGTMYKHELCLGPMSINDINPDEYTEMVYYLKDLRGSYENLANDFANLSQQLNMKNTSVDNCTRMPISYMESCKWIKTGISNNSLYPPKTLVCFEITEHGRDVQCEISKLRDIRLREYTTCDSSTQESLIRLGVFDMLDRAGYDVSKYDKAIKFDRQRCRKIVGTHKVLFSPYQVLKSDIVDRALNKVLDVYQSNIMPRSFTKNSNTNSLYSPRNVRTLITNLNLDQTAHEYDKNDTQICNLINLLCCYSNQNMTRDEIVDKVFLGCSKMKKDEFYPFVASIFRIMGFNCITSRIGDNGSRFDAIIIDDKHSIPIEIKSPTEEMCVSLKAIRQALENKIVLLSRKPYPTTWNTTSLVVGYYLPNNRAEVASLITSFKETYNLNVGIMDLKTLLEIACSILFDGKTINDFDLIEIEGYVSVRLE